jgi:hypothetical protein
MTYGRTLPLPGFPEPQKEPGRKDAIAMAKKKPITPKDFYLGPIPFNVQFPPHVEVPSKWLTNHWPKTRIALRREILETLTR